MDNYKCVSINHTPGKSSVTFSVADEKKVMTKGVMFVFANAKEVPTFEIGKDYTIMEIAKMVVGGKK